MKLLFVTADKTDVFNIHNALSLRKALNVETSSVHKYISNNNSKHDNLTTIHC